MATFVNDTFSGEASNVALSAHTGETGATWTTHPSYTDDLQVSSSSSNVAQAATGSSAAYYTSGVPATNEYDVQADFAFPTSLTSAANLGISGRMSTSVDEHYHARYNHGAGDWQLYRVQSGFNLLNSYTQSLSTATTYTCKLEIRTATKKWYVNGVERISHTNNGITNTGRAGTRWAFNATGNFNARMDNFSATDAPAGGGLIIPIAAYHYNHNTGSNF